MTTRPKVQRRDGEQVLRLMQIVSDAIRPFDLHVSATVILALGRIVERLMRTQSGAAQAAIRHNAKIIGDEWGARLQSHETPTLDPLKPRN